MHSRGQPLGTGEGREWVQGGCTWGISAATSPESGFHLPQVQSQGSQGIHPKGT